MSSLDKDWMSPQLKQIHRSMQREFFKNRKSQKYLKLKSKFKKLKRNTVKTLYSGFVTNLKSINPGKWYSMARKIGAVDKSSNGDIKIEALSNFSNSESAQIIAEHFSAVSNQYAPVTAEQLPCYLPAQMLPQVSEHEVYARMMRLKKTRSTLPIDIPEKLRREVSLHLAAPLTNIYNDCLIHSVYPSLWKNEWVTPAPKVTNPHDISDLRKISCTSDYSKLFESFIKDWVMQDINNNIDIGQFGGQKGTGTEHKIVCFVDRILQLLDTHPDKSAVIASCLDWSAAFDRQDPTLAISKFIKLGVRSSLIPLLISYLSDRKMRVKFNGEISKVLTLIGGGPQGTLLGGLEYMAQSNDNADIVKDKDHFKYVDDLSILQLICLAGLLEDYDFSQHIASDIGIDDKYLPAQKYETQEHLNYISRWTEDNLMKLNEAKCNYLIFSRSKEKFSTRLEINGQRLDRIAVTQLVGVWISEDMSWKRNTKEICKKAYARMSLITKLKYVGVSRDDLIDIYILFIRSVTEYCAVVFHSSLTQEDGRKLEQIQKTCLKVILGNEYDDYFSALKLCNLRTLTERREKKCHDFSLRCLEHPKNSRLFPENPNHNDRIRGSEPYVVNFASTERYKKSAIPYCQRILNQHTMKK